MKKIDFIIIAFFILLSVITLKDLFIPGFYTSHDGPNQVVRLYYFDKILHEGQIPPRWVGGLLNGFGYPLFTFSYQTPWYIAEPLHLIGFSFIDSIKYTFLVGFILSGISMYFFSKEIFGRWGGFISSFLYLFAPYRFANIFVRASIGDATAFIFPPFLFMCLQKSTQESSKKNLWIMLGGLSFGLLLLSHAMVFIFFFFMYILFAIYKGLVQRNIEYLRNGLLTSFYGVGISSFYLFPSLFEKGYTQFSDMFRMFFANATYVEFQKLLYSPWGYSTINAPIGGMSLQLGIAQWITVALVLIFFIFSFLKMKVKPSRWFQTESPFYLTIFILSILAMLPISKIFWTLLGNILVIDFTWRILPISVFCVAYLAGNLASKKKVGIILGVFLLCIGLYANRNHIHINQSLNWDVPFYLKLEKTTNTFDEYTPRWVKNEYAEKPREKIEFFDTTGTYTVEKLTSNSMKFHVTTIKPGKARINSVYYPGWQVYLDGKPVQISYNDTGMMDLIVPQGQFDIHVDLHDTVLRKISNIISILFLILCVFITWISLKKVENTVKRSKL